MRSKEKWQNFALTLIYLALFVINTADSATSGPILESEMSLLIFN